MNDDIKLSFIASGFRKPDASPLVEPAAVRGASPMGKRLLAAIVRFGDIATLSLAEHSLGEGVLPGSIPMGRSRRWELPTDWNTQA
jgi:hypothetical protein